MITLCDQVLSAIGQFRMDHLKEPTVIVISVKFREELRQELTNDLNGDEKAVTEAMLSNKFALYRILTVISPRNDFDMEVF